MRHEVVDLDPRQTATAWHCGRRGRGRRVRPTGTRASTGGARTRALGTRTATTPIATPRPCAIRTPTRTSPPALDQRTGNDQEDRERGSEAHRQPDSLPRPSPRSVERRRPEDAVDDLLGGRSAQLSVDIEQDAVGEDRRNERLDVVGRHEITTVRGMPSPATRGRAPRSPWGCRRAARRRGRASRGRGRRCSPRPVRSRGRSGPPRASR